MGTRHTEIADLQFHGYVLEFNEMQSELIVLAAMPQLLQFALNKFGLASYNCGFGSPSCCLPHMCWFINSWVSKFTKSDHIVPPGYLLIR